MLARRRGSSILRRVFEVVGLLFVTDALRFAFSLPESEVEWNNIKSLVGSVFSLSPLLVPDAIIVAPCV